MAFSAKRKKAGQWQKFFALATAVAVFHAVFNPVAASAVPTFTAADFNTVGLEGGSDRTITGISANGYLTFPLTRNVGTAAGAAWNKERVNLNQNFEINAQIYLGENDGGADGLAFVLQPNTTSSVSTGGGLGYQGITPSFAVEFDTYVNSSDSSNGSKDFMSFTKNGDTNHNSATNTGLPAQVDVGDLEDGNWRDFKFTYDATAKVAKAFLGGVEKLSTNIDLVTNIFSATSGVVYWGFTAATGGATNVQEVRFADNSVFTATPRTNTAPTINNVTAQTLDPDSSETIALTIADDLTTQSQWDISAVSNNPNLTVSSATITGATTANVAVASNTVAVTATVTVTVTDADGATGSKEFSVTVGTSPTEPFSISAHQYGTNADLTWTAPTSLGAVTDYFIEYSDDETTWVPATNVISSTTSETVTGLTDSDVKLFRVKAVNALGESSWATARTISFPRGNVDYQANVEKLVSDTGITPELRGYSSSTITVNINASNSGLLTLTTTTGLTIPSAFADVTEVGALSFSGTLAQVNTAIATLKFKKTVNGNAQIDIQAADSVGVVNTENDHVYEVVTDSQDWAGARTAAAAKTVPKLGGGTCPGYLATVTSAAENQFIYDKVRQASWLGGSDSVTEGSWYWVTDPDVSGTKFWQGAGSGSGGAAQNSMYTNWNGTVEPNDSGSNEDAIQMLASGLWNDLPASNTTLAKYIVEYGSDNCVPAATATTASVSYTAQVADVPGAPTSVAGTAGPRNVALTWTAPASDGGSAITDYVVEYKVSTGSTWVVVADGISTNASALVTGLVAGTAYVFRVKAVNNISASGGGYSVISSNVTPNASVPDAVTSITLATGDGTIDADWTAPVENGGSAITDYLIEVRPAGGSWETFVDAVSSTPSAVITGLTAGTEYQVRVSAINLIGTGPATVSSQLATVMTAPGDVSGLTLVAGNTQITASWTAPTLLGGGTLTDYYIYLSTNNKSTWTIYNDGVGTAASQVLTGLTNGLSYWVKVVAKNSGRLTSPGIISTNSVSPFAPAAPQPVIPVAPSPTPTPSTSVSPTPTASPKPSSSATPRPSVSPSASAPASPVPAPAPGAVPTPVLQPTVAPTPNVVYETIESIPKKIYEVLIAPIAFVLDAATGTPVLPELAPQESAVYVSGKSVDVEVLASETKDSYLLKGPDFEVTLRATAKNGQVLSLDDNGNILLNSDRFASFNGSGYAPGSLIKVWLFSDPTSLTQVIADEDGNFTGTATIPSNVPTGNHTLQLNGITQDGQVRSVALGVVLQETLGSDTRNSESAASANTNSGLPIFGLSALAVFALITILLVAKIRRRNS